ncbi:filamentous hemagglutinin N-terminal domain-containing protein [Campylobacter jejuni]|nr:filamentous hemagglutinin N-terminal domain-containing protein [Campylobacter jejuni]EAJ2607393.1 filamentous hemagglutinin N-terminal domain-containing protein [Campylobacter jejuni]EAJ8121877.1 filamentous hemagglutinin N-terminal domain-containing protein [Campylobacter jejuni]EDO7430942.1 filamentous hemagglutinin N-terminal domain-containing protein [Campylobacter jejuni]EGI1621330.1 filamentous hemagglutinin N-terminal domain-containing protein [Campylobacter jejuni]
MKKLNKLSLSLVVGSLLFTQSYALPSGGKFTHGTSGSINVNGNTMNITGNKVNSVIQWGGGFNIAKGETVNFGQGKTNQNYLNIAYGTKSSTIDGKLEGGSNNIFLINPNGIVVGKDGSINANKIVLSASSIGDKEMQEFASSGNIAGYEYKKGVSPVIKPNMGNVINTGYIKSDYIGIVAKQYADFDKDGNVGDWDSSNGIVFLIGESVSVVNGFWNAGWVNGNVYNANEGGFANNGMVKGSTFGNSADYIKKNHIVYETSNLITSADISNEVINSIFDALKINSYVDIKNLNKFYKENKQEFSSDELANIGQSMDFATALYNQASLSENESLKNALNSHYITLEKSNQAIIKTKEILSQIPKINEEQEKIQKTYDDAVETYNKAVEAYNTALNGITGNNGDKVLAGLKQAVDKASSDLQQATTALQTTTASNNSSLENSNKTLASASIDGTSHLTINGKYSANYKPVSIINSGSNNSNNGNDGTDSGDINNGNNNGSNNNPNDTIGQQEPDIATALLMQTTDEDPNINEDDKQASIDEASTQESGNACIVSDNFKAGNLCSR